MNTKQANKTEIFDLEKIRRLSTVDELLDEKYGKEGTSTREAFMKKAYSYYHQINAVSENKRMKQVKTQNILVSEEK